MFKYCIYLENLPKKCTRNFANLNIKNQPKANSLESMSHSLMTKFLLNWVCWIWIRTETNADPQHSLHGTGYLTRSKIYFIFVFYVRWGRRLPTYYVELEVDRPLLHLQRPLSSLPSGCCPAGQKGLLSSRPRRPPSSRPRRLPTSRPKWPVGQECYCPADLEKGRHSVNVHVQLVGRKWRWLQSLQWIWLFVLNF